MYLRDRDARLGTRYGYRPPAPEAGAGVDGVESAGEVAGRPAWTAINKRITEIEGRPRHTIAATVAAHLQPVQMPRHLTSSGGVQMLSRLFRGGPTAAAAAGGQGGGSGRRRATSRAPAQAATASALSADTGCRTRSGSAAWIISLSAVRHQNGEGVEASSMKIIITLQRPISTRR